MYNNLYTKILTNVNRLFGKDAYMVNNIPDDIRTWLYNLYHGIEIKGSIIGLDIGYQVFIIKSDNSGFDYILYETLMDNKPVRLIIINKQYFETLDEQGIYLLLKDIYQHITTDLFTFKSGSLYKVNQYAPFILTVQTMECFNIAYYSDWMSDIEVSIMNYICTKDLNTYVEPLLNQGGLISILNDIEIKNNK